MKSEIIRKYQEMALTKKESYDSKWSALAESYKNKYSYRTSRINNKSVDDIELSILNLKTK